MSWWCCYPHGAWESIRTIDEFGAGHNDCCGPAANENTQACIEGIVPTYAHMDAIRSFDIANGHFVPGGGQTINDVAWDIGHWHLLRKAVLHSFKPSFALYTEAEVIAALNACGHGLDGSGSGIGALIVECNDGEKWPHNEPGVKVHFGTCLAFDSVASNLGGHGAVYFGNSDREPLPKGTGKPDWISIPQLMAAGIIGMLEVYPKVTTPIPPTPPVDVAGAIVDIHSAQASLTAALSKLQPVTPAPSIVPVLTSEVHAEEAVIDTGLPGPAGPDNTDSGTESPAGESSGPGLTDESAGGADVAAETAGDTGGNSGAESVSHS